MHSFRRPTWLGVHIELGVVHVISTRFDLHIARLHVIEVLMSHHDAAKPLKVLWEWQEEEEEEEEGSWAIASFARGEGGRARQPGSRLQRTQKGPEPTRLWALESQRAHKQ